MFDHLVAMTDQHGLFEHADGTLPRIEHGYCTDDNARMLVVTSREPDDDAPALLSRIALGFTLASQTADGRTRNRMDLFGNWTDRPSTDDCWGRSLWAFGVAATHHDDPTIRATALRAFETGAQQRSPWSRSMAFAALGAADVLTRHPDHTAARELLIVAVDVIGTPLTDDWYWPERRLTYANATLAEAVMAAGSCLGEPALLNRGLLMLSWLLHNETLSGHLSVTGTDGFGALSTRPQFDQQPIEVAALADACWRAYTLTGRLYWKQGIRHASDWFYGANDSHQVMFDAASGGGFDGLTPHGVNLNQGAESTLAYISTMQRSQTMLVGVS